MISYETSPAASALQWLSKNQTAGKRHPYLFSQCQVGIDINEAKYKMPVFRVTLPFLNYNFFFGFSGKYIP